MADVHSKETRSYNMSRIKSKNTKPELLVRRYLFSLGFRYRLHVKDLPGKPDIVFRKIKTAIFIHGCFWHGHEGCKYFKIPQTRQEWWLKKIQRNQSLDEKNTAQLCNTGWHVITIFECTLRKNELSTTLSNLSVNLSTIRKTHTQTNTRDFP